MNPFEERGYDTSTTKGYSTLRARVTSLMGGLIESRLKASNEELCIQIEGLERIIKLPRFIEAIKN